MSTFAATEVAEFPATPLYGPLQMDLDDTSAEGPAEAPAPHQAFGERLALRRAELGWTQEEAAQAIDVAHRTYQRWEEGKSMPYGRNQQRITSAMTISIEELFGGRGADADATIDQATAAAILERLERLEDTLNMLGSALFPLEGADEDVARVFRQRRRARNESPTDDEEPEVPPAALG